MSDSSGGPQVSIGKGGRLIICHAGSPEGDIILEHKLIFLSKSRNNTYYHRHECHKEVVCLSLIWIMPAITFCCAGKTSNYKKQRS
jgi:hypothetical protein